VIHSEGLLRRGPHLPGTLTPNDGAGRQLFMKRIPSIDGLRGLAALAVVLFHYKHFFAPDIPFIHWGYLSVDLFFILSGYILSAKYFNDLRSTQTSATDFIVRRVARLWPLHVVTFVLVVGENWYFKDYLQRFTLITGQSTPDFVSNVLMMQGFSNTGLIFNPPSWSITVEFVFNVVWLGLIYVCWNSLVATGVALSAIAALAMCKMDLSVEPYHVFVGYLNHGLVRCAAGFSIGFLLWRHQPKLSYPNALTVLVLGVFGLLVVHYDAYVPYGVDFLIAYGIFPALVMIALKKSVLSSFLSSFRFLGTISYAIYLVQNPVAHGMNVFIIRNVGLPPPAMGVQFLAILFVCATCLHYLIERPAQRAIVKAYGWMSLVRFHKRGNPVPHREGVV
jgi:peptidoglycan/LPS O-acetylase OafA/YrhL